VSQVAAVTKPSPLTSRKILNLLLAVVTWPVLIIFGAMMQVHYVPLTAMVMTLGFVQVSHIFGQSAVDVYAKMPGSLASAASAPLETGSSLAASAVEALEGVLIDWDDAEPDLDDPETPAILME